MIQDQSRSTNWKKKWISGDIERQGRHILHVRERYDNYGLHSLDFYFTDSYRAVDRVTYNARTMNASPTASVSPPSPHGYLFRVATATLPSLLYLTYLFYNKDETTLGDVASGFAGFFAARLYSHKLMKDLEHDSNAWEEYKRYAAKLQNVYENGKEELAS